MRLMPAPTRNTSASVGFMNAVKSWAPTRTHRGHRTLLEFSRIVKKHSLSVLCDYGVPWRSTFLHEVLQYEQPNVTCQCSLANSLAYRINAKWALVSMFTNISVEIAVPEWKRGYLKETISQERGGYLSPVHLKVPVCLPVPGKNGEQELERYEKATALLSSWGGRPSWSHFGTPEMEQNPAITLAVRRGEHERELVEVSGTLSNLSILLLPSCLALIPLGLFQDVSLSLTLIYTLATDVVSVLPVAIKGIELIVCAARQHYGTVSHMYGAKNQTDLDVAETLVARCQLRSWYGRLGHVLLCTADAAMTLGILLEFATRMAVKRLFLRRQRSLEFLRKDHRETAPNGGLLKYMAGSSAWTAFEEP